MYRRNTKMKFYEKKVNLIRDQKNSNSVKVTLPRDMCNVLNIYPGDQVIVSLEVEGEDGYMKIRKA